MKILVADDEIQALEVLTDAIRKAYPEAAVYDFSLLPDFWHLPERIPVTLRFSIFR